MGNPPQLMRADGVFPIFRPAAEIDLKPAAGQEKGAGAPAPDISMVPPGRVDPL